LLTVVALTGSAALLLCIALAFTGCAGGQGSGPPGQPVAITAQPVGQIVPIGESATFSVTATGTAPLNYQWSENGAAIPGANGASYTTPAVALGANGSTTVGSFQVTVSNSVNSVASTAATLAAGARSPKPGDLRYLLFEQVTLPGMNVAGGSLLGVINYSFANSVGAPLYMGNNITMSGGTCLWGFEYDSLPPPMDNMAMYYQESSLYQTTVAAYLQSVAAPYTVITSMDIEPQYPCEAVAVSWVESPQNAFDQRLEVVAPAQVPAQVATDGQASRIVTAASFDASGNADLLSYGWTGDTTTVYETQTYVVPPTQVASTAASLAAAGYFISAFGGNDANGWVLVGARVQGDTLPRPMNINGTLATNPDSSAYFTPVVILEDSSAYVGAWEQ